MVSFILVILSFSSVPGQATCPLVSNTNLDPTTQYLITCSKAEKIKQGILRIVRFQYKDAYPVLINIIRHTKKQDVRILAIKALGALKARKALPFLRRYFRKARGYSLKRVILETIDEIGGYLSGTPRIVRNCPTLIKYYDFAQDVIMYCANAIRILGRSKSKYAWKSLSRILKLDPLIPAYSILIQEAIVTARKLKAIRLLPLLKKLKASEKYDYMDDTVRSILEEAIIDLEFVKDELEYSKKYKKHKRKSKR